MKKKFLLSFFAIFLSLVVVIPHNTFAVYEVPKNSLDLYVEKITSLIDGYYQGQKENMKNPYMFFNEVCKNLSNNDFELGVLQVTDDGELSAQYSARSSVFVTILCNSFTSATDTTDHRNTNFLLNNSIKTPTIRSLGVSCKESQEGSLQPEQSDCATWNRKNAVDYPYIFYNLAKYIFNDITNLTLARVYGLSDSNSSTKDLANAYAVNTFNTVLSLPQKKNYPKTFKSMEKNIKLAKNIHHRTSIIDSSKRINEEKSDLCNRQVFLQYDSNVLERCQHIEEVNTLAQYNGISIDILYNELFFYTLFNQLYENYLEYFWRDGDLPDSLKSIQIQKAIKLQKQRTTQQYQSLLVALDDSIRQINNASALYPIHIGLLMYQEGLLELRNNLAAIYLPLHQLHYKLENIQSK